MINNYWILVFKLIFKLKSNSNNNKSIYPVKIIRKFFALRGEPYLGLNIGSALILKYINRKFWSTHGIGEFFRI
jgi:hypothetical protein